VKPAPPPVSRARPLLGTLVEISLEGLGWTEANAAIDAGFAAVAEVHRLMSFHESGSDISRINREAAAGPVCVDPHTGAVLRKAQDIAAASDGVFDITTASRLVAWGFLPQPDAPPPAPDASWRDIRVAGEAGRTMVGFDRPLWVDLGGIAKGYAVDAALRAMALPSGVQAVVNAGGDLRVAGPRPEAVRLRLPLPAEAIPVIEIAEGSLASSSGREHIRPHGGRSVGPHVHGISGASVIDRFVSVAAEECIVADALTKVVMALGSEAEPVLRRYGASAYMYGAESGWITIGDGT
jgi:thiamine biosynthesis lipoprotein